MKKQSVLKVSLLVGALFSPLYANAADVGRVYTMTNAADGNAIMMFNRADDGTLTLMDSISTHGLGTGAGLGNQSGIAISEDNQWLLVVNAGSDDVSVFAITEQGLVLTDRERTRGDRPVSVALDGSTVYVLNADSNDVQGFLLSRHGKLKPLLASRRHLSGDNTAPAQIGFSPDGRTLVVTEKATNTVTSFEVGFGGYLGKPSYQAATGGTPFGFAFGRRGQLFVTHAEGGAAGASSVGAYQIDSWSKVDPIEAAAPTFQAAACWLVVSFDKSYAYSTNPGSNTISGFHIDEAGHLELLNGGVSASLPAGSVTLDMALSDDGKYLYALNSGTGSINGYLIGDDGELMDLGQFTGLPAGVNGLVAR